MTGMSIRDRGAMVEAARLIRSMGARAVLVKGGHLEGRALDVLDEEGEVTYFDAERVETTSTHGTGCTLAAAIASCLARGYNVKDSVALAKRYVTEAIRTAPGLGRGHGPINHAVAVNF
jgi:hydroxymethylpyrimidine kinase/phosphomethylpyrimidine kinase